MPNRFNKLSDSLLLEGLPPGHRVAVAAAALERMSAGYAVWSIEEGRPSVGSILDGVWAYVAMGKGLPNTTEVESLYPSPDAPVTLESPYAESFLEALQLLALFDSTQETMRLVEVREAAYNMSDNAAGDVLVRYSDPQFNHRLTPEIDQLMANHPWVTRELEAQSVDIKEAQRESDFSQLIARLRTRALAHPVVSVGELDEIRRFQAG
jgi:hypothetical protein